jgi:hypothetical protein
MQEGYHAFEGGPFQVSADRVDDKVTIRLYRERTSSLEIQTTRKGAQCIADQITRVLW